MFYVQKKSWDSLQVESNSLISTYEIYFWWCVFKLYNDMYLCFNFITKLSHKSASGNACHVAPFNSEKRRGTSQGLLWEAPSLALLATITELWRQQIIYSNYIFSTFSCIYHSQKVRDFLTFGFSSLNFSYSKMPLTHRSCLDCPFPTFAEFQMWPQVHILEAPRQWHFLWVSHCVKCLMNHNI